MVNDDANGNGKEIQSETKDYALSGKIMLIAIVVLFVIIIIMLCLHVYVRWHLLRARRRSNRLSNRRSNRPQFVFTISPAALTVASRGLHPSVIASLPVFTFTPSSHRAECAVCLSDLQNGETGRVLPRCSHTFHIDCIDMWFQSHSTCPLCRTLVELRPDLETRPEVTINVCEAEPGSSSEPCEGEEVNRSGAEGGSSSSLCGEVTESGCESQSSIRSPVRRILSFKRILSREKKGSVSGCGTELDAERGDSVSC